MIGDFYNAFKRPDDARKLPKSVLDVLREDIPKDYDFEYDEALGHLIAVPKDKSKTQKLKFNIDFGALDSFPDWAKESLPNSLLDYAYRSQKPIPLKSVEVEDENGKRYPFDKLTRDVFSNEQTSEFYMFPSPFPPGKKVLFETESGKSKEITIHRVASEEPKSTRMENADFPALSLRTLYFEDKRKNATFSISATPKKAETVIDAIIALEILKGYVGGSLKINGTVVGRVLSAAPDYDKELLEAQLTFWNGLLILEDILKVKFNPKAKMEQKDYRLFEELAIAFIDKQDIKLKEPTSYISVNPEAINDPAFRKMALEDKSGFALSYISGPVGATLLEADFSFYSTNVLLGIKVDHVENEDGETKLYLISALNEPWIMYKRYTLDEESANKEQKRMQSAYLNNSL